MELFITPVGSLQAIYGEEIPLHTLGALSITRASTVEPNAHGEWIADLSPVGGPVLGPFDLRSQALQAEIFWLRSNQWSARASHP